MKQEKPYCRVPEGQTPITWEFLRDGIFVITTIALLSFSVCVLFLWFFGEVLFFPDQRPTYEVGCYHSVQWSIDKILVCNDGGDYRLAN